MSPLLLRPLRAGAPLLLLLSACAAPKTASPTPRSAEPPRAAVMPEPVSFRMMQPLPGPPSEATYPAAETETLPGGLTLLVLRRPTGVVSLSVVVRGGASAVPPGKSGLAALTARMLTEGTTRRSALGLAEAAENMGSVLEESAARDSIRLGITVERRDLEPGLSLLAEVLEKPAFAPADIERVRREWLDSIEAERQAPARLSSLVGLRLLLGPQVGAPVGGSRSDVRNITRRDLVAFHRETVVPANTAVVVVGDVALSEVKPAVQRLFSGKSAGGEPKAAVVTEARPPEWKAPAPGHVVVLDRPGAVQTAFFLAQPLPRRSEPGHEVRELLNGLLGGLFTSRINMNLREKHAYTYGARSVSIATRSWGAFAVMTSVRTDVSGAALSEILAELRAARDAGGERPIAIAEVKRAQADLQQELGASLAHTADTASRIEDAFVLGLPADHYQKYPLRLNAITLSDVQNEATSRLAPEGLVMIAVGDRTALEPQLVAAGFAVDAAPESLAD